MEESSLTIEKITTENDDLKEKCVLSKEINDKLTIAMEVSSSETSEVTIDNDLLKERICSLINEISEMQISIQTSADRIDSDLSIFQQEKKVLMELNNQLIASIEEAKSTSQAFEDINITLTTNVGQLKCENNMLDMSVRESGKYVCIYRCMDIYVFLYIFMYVHTYICILIFTYINKYVNIHLYIYIYIHLCIKFHMNIYRR
jgi:hypothetical protein